MPLVKRFLFPHTAYKDLDSLQVDSYANQVDNFDTSQKKRVRIAETNKNEESNIKLREADRVASLVGCIRELAVLSAYATETLGSLYHLVEDVHHSTLSLTKRVNQLNKVYIPQIEREKKILNNISTLSLSTNTASTSRLPPNIHMTSLTTPALFVKPTNNAAIMTQYNTACQHLPPLWKLEHALQFLSKDKDNENNGESDVPVDLFILYSYPGMFFTQWLQSEILKQEAEKTLRKKKKKLLKEKKKEMKLLQISSPTSYKSSPKKDNMHQQHEKEQEYLDLIQSSEEEHFDPNEDNYSNYRNQSRAGDNSASNFEDDLSVKTSEKAKGKSKILGFFKKKKSTKKFDDEASVYTAKDGKPGTETRIGENDSVSGNLLTDDFSGQSFFPPGEEDQVNIIDDANSVITELTKKKKNIKNFFTKNKNKKEKDFFEDIPVVEEPTSSLFNDDQSESISIINSSINFPEFEALSQQIAKNRHRSQKTQEKEKEREEEKVSDFPKEKQYRGIDSSALSILGLDQPETTIKSNKLIYEEEEHRYNRINLETITEEAEETENNFNFSVPLDENEIENQLNDSQFNIINDEEAEKQQIQLQKMLKKKKNEKKNKKYMSVKLNNSSSSLASPSTSEKLLKSIPHEKKQRFIPSITLKEVDNERRNSDDEISIKKNIVRFQEEESIEKSKPSSFSSVSEYQYNTEDSSSIRGDSFSINDKNQSFYAEKSQEDEQLNNEEEILTSSSLTNIGIFEELEETSSNQNHSEIETNFPFIPPPPPSDKVSPPPPPPPPPPPSNYFLYLYKYPIYFNYIIFFSS